MPLNQNQKISEPTDLPQSAGDSGAPISDPSSEAAEISALAQLIVRTLNLETDASRIDPDAALYGEGLGLDSIDILEIALIVSQTYGVNIKSDDEKNVSIFSSLRNLNTHIQRYRTK
jgi:acyl carrier protein